MARSKRLRAWLVLARAVKAGLGGSAHFKGVSWNQRDQKWYATIQMGKKKKFLGQFDDEEEAAETYDEVARSLDKPVNFPGAGEEKAGMTMLQKALAKQRSAAAGFAPRERTTPERTTPSERTEHTEV